MLIKDALNSDIPHAAFYCGKGDEAGGKSGGTDDSVPPVRELIHANKIERAGCVFRAESWNAVGCAHGVQGDHRVSCDRH